MHRILSLDEKVQRIWDLERTPYIGGPEQKSAFSENKLQLRISRFSLYQ